MVVLFAIAFVAVFIVLIVFTVFIRLFLGLFTFGGFRIFLALFGLRFSLFFCLSWLFHMGRLAGRGFTRGFADALAF